MGLMDVLRGMQHGPHGAPRSGGSSGGTGTDTGSNPGGTGTSGGTGGGTGMSPITMAILGLLAYKALKSMTHQGEHAPAGGPSPGAGNGNGHGGSIPNRDTLPRNTSSGSDMGSAPRDSDMGRGWGGGLGDLLPGSGSHGTGSSQGGGTQSGGAGTQSGGTQSAGQGTDAGGGGGSISDLIKGALGTLLAGGAAGGVMSGGLNDFLKQMQKHGFTDHADSWTSGAPNKPIPPGDLAKVLGPDQIESMMAQSGLSREELLDGLSKHLPEVVNRLTPDGQVPHHIPM